MATAPRSRSLKQALRGEVRLPRPDPLLVAAIVCAVGARIAYWAYTGARWEDALITLTQVQNAVNGLGLVHHLGEGRVQGFTSAVSALVPLAGEVLHHGWGLLALRLVSLVAAAASVTYAWAIARILGLGRLPTVFVLAYLAFDANQILFAVAGMETQIAVAILLGGVYHLLRGQTLRTGAFLGLAMLVRPEFVLWVLPALAYLVWRDRASGRRDSLRALGMMLAVWAPWLIFTTAYYGSPIPHTIPAKAAGYTTIPSLGAGVGAWWQWAKHMISLDDETWWHLAPFYENFQTSRVAGAFWFVSIAFAVSVLALAGVWLTRARTAWRPALAFGLVFPVYIVFFVGNYFMWYVSPWLALVMLCVGVALTRAGQIAPRAAGAAAIVLALAFTFQTPFQAKLERTLQNDIEQRVRQPMSEYLHAAVRPGQSVASESAGYVGYYGHVKLYDFPGLTSPTSLRAVRSLPPRARNFVNMAALLHPDWIVARASEYQELRQAYPGEMSQYVVAAHFAVPESRSRLHTAAVSWLSEDRDYYVLRRRDVRGRPVSPLLYRLQ